MKPVWAIIAVSFLAAGMPPLLRGGVNAETGSYVFQHYTPDQYNAAPENWAVAQDSRGVMYFGNTSTILEFDGQSWRSIPISNGSFGRSVGVDSKGTVYAGGVGVFGVLQPDRDGAMRFVPLMDKVPEADRKIRDVWRVLPTPQGVYFTAYERLFRLNANGSIHVWRPVSNFGRAVAIGDSVYVKTREQGLLRVEGDALVPVPGGQIFKSIGVTAAATTDRGGLIATPAGLFRIDSRGIAPFPTAADAYFASKQVYTISVFPDGEIAAGTRTGGLVLLNRDGGLDRILTRASGLTDDYVSAIFRDRQGGVWLAGNNGLTFVNPGLTRFADNLGLKGLVRFVARANGAVYAGSTSGLFRMNAAAGREPAFEQITGIDNTVTWIVSMGKQVLAGTDVGLFSVTGNRAVEVLPESRKTSVYGIVASAVDPSVIYTAGFAGIRMLRQNGNAWKKVAEFAVNGQSFQSLSEDPDGRVWAATNDAIWRLDLRGEQVAAESFGEPQGVPPGLKNPRLFHGHTVFATPKGLLRFSESAKRFEADNELGPQFADGSRDVFDLFTDPRGNVWVTGGHYHSVLLKQADGYRWLNAPLLGAGIQEIYQVAFDDSGVAWAYGAGGVLYRWEQSLYGDPDENFQVIARRVGTVGGGRTIYGGAGTPGSVRLPFRENALRFEFAAPFSEKPDSVEYQVKLEGSDPDWSAWSHEPGKEYNYISEGSYKLRVRARSPHGAIAESAALPLGILPPWYRTWWAYGIYLAMSGVFVWAFVRWRTRQLMAEKEQLEHVVEERTVEIREQRDEIHRQERQGHALLLNILPESVAQELKTSGAVRPVGFDDVTVCFTDFVGFTLSSERLSPSLLVEQLNRYFTAFDEIVAAHGLEKLKTIGDSYMFAAGLPAPRASHAVDAVLAALEMVEVVKDLERQTEWNIRVGLHSGPVVAGVVGTRKFAFDIWGNTVNLASRMESSGVPGRVNVSERTFHATRGLIDCEARGHIHTKDGRDLPMYLVTGAAEGFAAKYEAAFGENPQSARAAAIGASQ